MIKTAQNSKQLLTQMGGGKQRSSNVELLRCVAMLMIIIHHYCVNSGITDKLDFENNPINTLIVQFMAFGGKAGVNIFFIISGYFMITGKMKWEKVGKLLLQIAFYSLIVRLSLWWFGGYTISPMLWLGALLPVIFAVPQSFVASYIFVYLLSPLVNRGLNALSRKEFNYLLGVLLFFFTIEQTFLLQNTWHYFGWAFVMYCIGAYIRRFDVAKTKFPWRMAAILSVLAVWGLILAADLIKFRFGWQYFIFDANKATMLVCSVCIFIAFLTFKIPYARLINYFGGASLGILMIHANCDAMRQWLWRDTLDVPGQIDNPWLLVHMLAVCMAIFIICGTIEIARKQILEEPIFNIAKRCCTTIKYTFLK